MTLTKADIVDTLFRNNNITKDQAIAAVEGLLRIAKDCLSSGDDLLLTGFGKFNIKQKKARRGRNPHTGKELVLAARKVVTFHPSGKLRNLVNGS